MAGNLKDIRIEILLYSSSLLMFVILSGCWPNPDPPEDDEPPYILSHVEITPQPATHADTVRIEVFGKENPYGQGNGSTIDFYRWFINSLPLKISDKNYVYWFNETGKDTIYGNVWGAFKAGTAYTSTGTVNFSIIYESNQEVSYDVKN